MTLEGQVPGVQYSLLRRSSRLPVGRAGELLFDRIHEAVDAIPAEFRTALRNRERGAFELELPGARISGAHAAGGAEIVYSRLSGKYVAAAFLRHLLCNALRPQAGRLLTFEPAPAIWRFEPWTTEAARERLGEVINLYRRGLTGPLPFFSRSSWSFLQNGDLGKAARAFYTPDKYFASFDDYDDPAVRICFAPDCFEDASFVEEFAECARTLLALPEVES